MSGARDGWGAWFADFVGNWLSGWPVGVLEPVWLLLVVPLAWAWWRWRPPGRTLAILRALLLAVLVLALCRPALRLPSRTGNLIVVVDRSASLPEDAPASAVEVLNLLQTARPESAPDREQDRLGVVAFGERAAVEQTPQRGRFGSFVHDVGSDASELGQALDAAIALLPPETPGRVLVLSDGLWTGVDPAAAAGRATLRGIPIDFRLLERSGAGDLAVEDVELPREVSPGEGYLITAWVRSPVSQEIDVELRRGDQVLAAGRRAVPAGRSRLTFRDLAGAPGTYGYQLSVRPAPDADATATDAAAPDARPDRRPDPRPENDIARLLLSVRGPRPVLVASDKTAFAELLRAGGLHVERRSPTRLDWSLAELSRYSAVVLEDVPAHFLGTGGMETLAVWVRDGAGGLMTTGGPNAYGPGGYYRSPLEAVLPVSMELRQEHRRLSLAVAVALDRSGSMAALVPDGRTKMDLANLATVQVLDLLTPMDQMAVIAVDSQPHVIAPLDDVEVLRAARGAILQIESMGGGIFVYEALLAAVDQLATSQAGARHIVLFADAADAEEPGNYKALLDRCRESGITASVIGLGTPQDADAPLLEDIARRGGGRAYITESPYDLPRLFAQDTFIVARSSFVEETTAVRATAALSGLTGRAQLPDVPSVGGYNLTYLRPEASLAAVSQDDYEAPMVASWQVGLGRALALTTQVDGPHTGDWATWTEAGDFLTSLARWTAGESGDLPLLVRQRLDRGLLRVELHLDPDRRGDPFRELPQLTVLRGRPGAAPETRVLTPKWVTPDQLEVQVPLHGDDVVLTTLDLPGAGQRTLPAVRLPYSPEHRPAPAGSGLAALERLARATGGRQRVDLKEIWNEFPRQPKWIEAGPWPVLLAIVLLLLEVLERRTGLVTAAVRRLPAWRWRRGERRARVEAEKPAPKRRPRPKRQRRVESVKAEAAPESQSKGEEVPEVAVDERGSGKSEEKDAGVVSALGKARQRARQRVER